MTSPTAFITPPLGRRRPAGWGLGPRRIGALGADLRWHHLALLAILALSA